MVSRTRLTLLICAALGVPGGALAARSDWTAADESQLRLLVTAPASGGIVDAGIEIQLEPDWYTYWRNPGESGVPPMFDFSGSDNVGNVEVLYPAPVRYDDGTTVSLIYRDEVVFPLKITPLDPARPLTLRVSARFGVCSSICIPTSALAEVTLDPSPAPDPLSASRVASFERRVPKPPTSGRLDIETVTAAADSLLIDVRMPDSTYADLFAEPPAGWFVGQPAFVTRSAGISRYRLSLAGKPADATLPGQTFRFVAVAGGEAIEKAVTLK